jgi:hypothetical protein
MTVKEIRIKTAEDFGGGSMSTSSKSSTSTPVNDLATNQGGVGDH